MRRVYDLAMTHQLDADDFFIHRVQEHCAARGLNFFLVEPLWIEGFYTHLAAGKVFPRVLLNMHSEHHRPDDLYHRLVRLAHERGVKVIDPPETAFASFNKAVLHPRLVAARVNVPATVIVPQALAGSFQLTDEQRLALGSPFVIKPAMGYGRRGVVLNATSERDIAQSVAKWPDDDYLLQRRIVPKDLDGQPAYFRVYHVFGSLRFCWWNCFTDRYRVLSVEEQEQHGLGLLADLVHRIAALTGMRFFSTEIALTDAGELVVIDYVNDQCHLLTQTASPQNGVPDEVVAAIAFRLVEGAQQLVNGR
jgi:hypothetical protein